MGSRLIYFTAGDKKTELIFFKNNFFFKRWLVVFSFLFSSRNFLSSFLFLALACGILVPHPGIEPMLLAVKAWSLSQWTPREVPRANLDACLFKRRDPQQGQGHVALCGLRAHRKV